MSRRSLVTSCLEHAVRRAYDLSHAAAPCGVFLPGAFGKRPGARGRPAAAHRASVPAGWELPEWQLSVHTRRRLADHDAWLHALAPADLPTARWFDRAWVTVGLVAISGADAELGIAVRGAILELEQAWRAVLRLDARVALERALGVDEDSLHEEPFGSAVPELLKVLQLTYVALRLDGCPHDVAWDAAVGRLWRPAPVPGGDRGVWMDAIVRGSLRNRLRLGRDREQRGAGDRMVEVRAVLLALRRGQSARWAWLDGAGRPVAADDDVAMGAVFAVLFERLADQRRNRKALDATFWTPHFVAPGGLRPNQIERVGALFRQAALRGPDGEHRYERASGNAVRLTAPAFERGAAAALPRLPRLLDWLGEQVAPLVAPPELSRTAGHA